MTFTVDSDFMAAIVADPADDCPRLVYADYLEERGETLRAECIRVGIAIAKWEQELKLPKSQIERDGWLISHCIERRTLIGEPCDCLLHMKQRLSEIWRSFPTCLRAEHVYPLYGLFRNSGKNGHSVFSDRRGFPYLVSCTLAEWLEHGSLIVRHQPIEVVRLRDRDSQSNSLARGRYGWWASLDIRPPDNIHSYVWNYLSPEERGLGHWVYYSSVEAANADLSQACLKWAREQP